MAMDIKKLVSQIATGIAIIAVLVGPFIVGYQMGKSKGYQNCVKQKKPEAVVQAGGVANYYTSDPADRPLIIGLRIMRVGFGLVIDRK